MADIVITAGNVAWVSGDVETGYNYGESVTAGQVVILSASNTWVKADCNGASTINGSVTTQRMGVALLSGSSGQKGLVQTNGVITIGGTVVVNMGYVLSGTAGGIAPFADLVALTGGTAYGCFIGFGLTATTLELRFIRSGVATP